MRGKYSTVISQSLSKVGFYPTLPHATVISYCVAALSHPVFIDIKGAFDSTSNKSIKKAMIKHEIPEARGLDTKHVNGQRFDRQPGQSNCWRSPGRRLLAVRGSLSSAVVLSGGGTPNKTEGNKLPGLWLRR